MQSIRSLVVIDDKARFRRDVQLSAFDSQNDNLELLKSYLFTVASPGINAVGSASQVSAVDLLNKLLDAYRIEREHNRFVVIADYGHGKSHLALALANYFSKAYDSPEFGTVKKKLEHSVNNPAKASTYDEFKRQRGEFLVIRLRGDTPSSLREQFIPSVERALAEHPATAHVKPHIWHDYALKLLTDLSPEEVSRANKSLETRHIDVPALIRQVQERKDVRDLCVEALDAAKNMAPDLGAQLDLRQSIEWVTDTLCGENKPLGGVLVMFDEFSLYVTRYAQRGAIGELMDLLNGITNRPAKAAFLAFAQHDPETLADNLGISDFDKASLKRELNRIDKKLSLYSLMESVIDAYLRQRDSAWQEFMLDFKVRSTLQGANDVAFSSYDSRYGGKLGWFGDVFFENVTKGCFPLHPLTTALLCNLRFSIDSGSQRTVLGFVIEQLMKRENELAVINEEINWVRPLALVEYYGEGIDPEAHKMYQNARQNLRYDAKEDERKVLMALYLQQAAKLILSPSLQRDFISEATGIPVTATKQSLASLASSNVIRYDEIKETYLFWPLSDDPGKLARMVSSKFSSHPFDNNALDKFNQTLASEYGRPMIRVAVSWGHEDDWAASQYILVKEEFNTDKLRMLAGQFRTDRRSVTDGARGLVVWLLARDEEQVAWFRSNIEIIVDSAFRPDETPPILVVLPREPSNKLIEAFRRHLVLENLTQSERTDVGTSVLEYEMRQAKGVLRSELDRLMGDTNISLTVKRESTTYVTPSPFRATLATKSLSLQDALKAIYGLAYRFVPQEFFTEFRATTQGNNHLRNAVKQVAGTMFSGNAKQMANTPNSTPIPKRLCEMILIGKWGILSSDYSLRQPTDNRLKSAWQYLDKAFPATKSEVPVIHPLVRLLNPPYGYDYNTVLLLFSAWFGFNVHDIDVARGGRKFSANDLGNMLAKGPKEFLNICIVEKVTLSRRSPGEVRQQVMDIVEKVNHKERFTEKEARVAQERLIAFIDDERNSQNERATAREKEKELGNAIEVAVKYQEQARAIKRSAETEGDYRQLIQVIERLSQLPRPTIVTADAAEPEELRKSIMERLGIVVEKECARLANPKQSTEIGLCERDLTQLRDALNQAGIHEFKEKIEQAYCGLRATEIELARGESEAAVRAKISKIDTTGKLNYLHENANYLRTVNENSQTLRTLRDSKLAYVVNEISRLEQHAKSLSDQIDGLDTSQKVAQLRDQVLRENARYQGSSYQETIQNAIHRLTELREMFTAVERIRAAMVQSPTDAQQQLDQLDQIKSRFDGNLSETQFFVITQAQNRVKEQVVSKQGSARAWLDEREKELQVNENIGTLASQLASPSPFLPEDELPRLERLRALVQERLDGDAVLRIEMEFRRLSGHQTQQACLQRLTEIMNDVQTDGLGAWREKA